VGAVTVEVNGFEWQGKKVLVTGASGFKGAWLSRALHDLGARVYGTIRSDVHPDSAYNLLGCQRFATVYHTDVVDREHVNELINKIVPDVIFHLAAKALVPMALRYPRRTYDVNFTGTLNLIEACREEKICERLLICSTDHVFGHVDPAALPARGFDERTRVSYGGPYDTSKAAMELMVRSYHYSFWAELPAVGITRCANVFGLGDTNARRVIPYFISSAKDTGKVDLQYNLNGRQFIYVTDAIVGYIKAAASLNEGGYREKRTAARPDSRSPFTPTFHFAIEDYGDTHSPYIQMLAVANLTAELTGARANPATVDYAENENKVQALNCDATRRTLGWSPHVSFAEGIAKLAEWFDARGDTSALARLAETDAELIVKSAISKAS